MKSFSFMFPKYRRRNVKKNTIITEWDSEQDVLVVPAILFLNKNYIDCKFSQICGWISLSLYFYAFLMGCLFVRTIYRINLWFRWVQKIITKIHYENWLRFESAFNKEIFCVENKKIGKKDSKNKIKTFWLR